MKKYISLFFLVWLVLVGCNQGVINGIDVKSNSKDKIYSESWDSNPIIVKQQIKDADAEIINEIDDTSDVKKLIEELKNADWQENVEVDIRPPDYRFNWNSYEHNVWINEESDRLEFSIEGKSNYGTMSKSSSVTVFEILTGRTFNRNR